MKKTLVVLLLVLAFGLPIVALSGGLLADNANLLSSTEREELSELLETLSDEVGFDIAVVTVTSLDGRSVRRYTEDFYKGNGYGRGEYDSGIMLLVSIGDREFHIHPQGRADKVFDYFSLATLESAFIDSLSSGDYYGAFYSFGIAVSEAVENQGDNTYYEDSSESGIGDTRQKLLIALVIGLVISFILVTVKKMRMTTVKAANSASDYVIRGSLNVTHSSDRYLYSTVTKVRKSNNSGGGRSSRGGRSGKF